MKDLVLIYGGPDDGAKMKEIAAKLRTEITKAPKEQQKLAPAVQLRTAHMFDVPETRVIAIMILTATDEVRDKIEEAYRRKGARVIDADGNTVKEPYPPEDATNKAAELPQSEDGSHHELPNDPAPVGDAELPPDMPTTESGDPVDPSVLREQERRAAKVGKKGKK